MDEKECKRFVLEDKDKTTDVFIFPSHVLALFIGFVIGLAIALITLH